MTAAAHLPRLVTRDQLLELADALGTASCREFVGNYVSMWQDRFDRLHTAVRNADDAAAMDVVLSIKISSEMAGADRLACLARCAQQRLAHSGASELASMLSVIAACGSETMPCLLATLD